MDRKEWYPELAKGLWRENPVFVAVLGLCPALAVTNTLVNGLAMGAATLFVLVGSSLLVSLLRHGIPKPVRISLFIIIIATFVTVVDFSLAALAPEVHRQLGAFISLIVVNCLILGRQEAFASRHRPVLAVADAVGMGLGFSLALVLIGGVRELLGAGSLGGVRVLGEHFEPWVIMSLPPGGFLTLGVLLMLFNRFQPHGDRRADSAGAGNFFLDGGGDIVVSGRKEGRPWRVGIRHPRRGPGSLLAVVSLTSGAVATSGDYERFRNYRGTRYHHIIDPRTGLPARGCQSVTILAPRAELADALATAVFVLGPTEGLALVRELEEPGVEALIVEASGELVMTDGFREKARFLDGEDGGGRGPGRPALSAPSNPAANLVD